MHHNYTDTIACLKHGQIITSQLLGDISVVSKATALSSGFGYAVPVSQVATSNSLLLLLDGFYSVVEPIDIKHFCLLFPISLAQKLLHMTQNEPVSEVNISNVELIRLLTSQLAEKESMGICLRGGHHRGKNQFFRCAYQILRSQEKVSTLESSINRIVDFSLLFLEKEQKLLTSPSANHLQRAVESHRF